MERNAPADARTLEEWQRILDDEVVPYLDHPVETRAPNGTRSYSAFASCHTDVKRSLTVSVGDWKPVVWCCHSCLATFGEAEMERRTRRAMLDRGVSPKALKLSVVGLADMEDKLRALLKSGVKGQQFKLCVAAIVESYDELPAGGELEALAGSCGVSEATAYRLRDSTPPDHLYVPQDQKPRQAPQVRRAS